MAKFYVTGDLHGSLGDLIERIEFNEINNCILIILGDMSFNYYGDRRDEYLKQYTQDLCRKKYITIFAIRGNHEKRPYPPAFPSKKVTRFKGICYCEEAYPNILYAKDGEFYDFKLNKTKTITAFVLGGAYSIDKEWRILCGAKWFADEQMSEVERNFAYADLLEYYWLGNKVDLFLTHTAPLKYVPKHLLIPNIPQSKVDKSMEIFLDKIDDEFEYEHWLFGHFHSDEDINDKVHLLHQTVVDLEDYFK